MPLHPDEININEFLHTSQICAIYYKYEEAQDKFKSYDVTGVGLSL